MQKIKLFELTLILVFVFWKFLLPGARVANDYPYIYSESAESAFRLPSLWSDRGAEGLGENTISTLWSWPVDFLYGFGAKVGLRFSGLERVFGLIPFLLLGIWGITRFLRRFGILGWANISASLFYLANTYILLLIDGGQLSIALAYAWFPTAYLSWEDGVSGGFKKRIVTGLALSVLGFLDIRFLYILAILITLRFLYELTYPKTGERLQFLLKSAATLFIVFLIFCGLNAYWILPAVKGGSFALPVLFQRSLDASNFSFANIGHSLSLLSPHWFKNVFGKITEIRAEFFLIPVLAFLAPILRRKNKNLGFWLLISALGIFLVKGTNPPLAGVYPWLSLKIPGFFLLRDSSKFFFFIALGYTYLIGVTVSELQKKLKFKVPIIPMVTILYLLYLASPAFLGKMTGTLSTPPNKLEYFEMANQLKEDGSFGRILWISSKATLGYSSPQHPSIETLRLLNIRPFAASVKGTYETTNFLRAPYIGQILDIAGISYIAYPFPDTRREEIKPDNVEYYHQFVDRISGYDWAESLKDYGTKESPISLIKTRSNQDKFFIAENKWLVVGSDDVYSRLITIPNFKLSDNALIFIDEKPGRYSYFDPQEIEEFSGIILNGKARLDYLASSLEPKLFIYPAQSLGFSPDGSGWWKREGEDVISWRGFLQEKYDLENSDFDFSGDWSVAEGEKELRVESEKLKKGERLLVRVMVSPKGGSLSFYQNETLIGSINTYVKDSQKIVWEAESDSEEERIFDKANFYWFEVGDLVLDGQVSIKSKGDINVVNALASVPPDLLKESEKSLKFGGVELDLSKVDPNNLEQYFSVGSQVGVTYKQISPTEYKVKISGIEDSSHNFTLVFSSTYSPLWKLDGRQAFPVCSFLNGFTVSKDGEYTISYEPQRYVIPGLWISGVTLLSLLCLFLIKK